MEPVEMSPIGIVDPSLRRLAACLPGIYCGRFVRVDVGRWVLVGRDSRLFPGSLLALDRDGVRHVAGVFGVASAERRLLATHHPHYPHHVTIERVADAFAWLDAARSTDALTRVVDELAWRRVGPREILAPLSVTWPSRDDAEDATDPSVGDRPPRARTFRAS